MNPRAARIGLVAAALALGCKSNADTVLVVNVRLPDSLVGSQAVVLRAIVTASSGKSSSADFKGREGGAVSFPTSFSLQLPRTVGSPVRLEVVAFDGKNNVLARSLQASLPIKVGERNEVNILLGCDGDCSPTLEAAATAPSASTGGAGRRRRRSLRKRLLDDGELCDPGIPAGRRAPARPPIATTTSNAPATSSWGPAASSSAGTRRSSTSRRVTACCPTGGSAATDPDCSATCGNGALDPGEACDHRPAAGNPNSCPDAARCDDQDPCTRDGLVSAGTCAAVCVHQPILPRRRRRLLPAERLDRNGFRLPSGVWQWPVDKPAAESCDRGCGRPTQLPRDLPQLPGELPRRRQPLHHRRAGGRRLSGGVPASAHRALGGRRWLLPARRGAGGRPGLPRRVRQRRDRAWRGLRQGHRRRHVRAPVPPPAPTRAGPPA
jgi:hypothetical protein